jgi:hypothetical protein
MKHAKLKAAILAVDPYRLACSIRRRTGCSMRDARRRAQTAKNLVRPKLTSAELARITRNVHKGRP